MLDNVNWRRLVLAACACAICAGIASFWWLCDRSPKIPYLPRYGGAEWVIYPTPPSGKAHFLAELSTEFHRALSLDKTPSRATLGLRALRRFRITINGTPVTAATVTPTNWKNESFFEITRFLRAGTNDISITVFNERGPPALWSEINLDASHLGTGTDWDASLLGAAWQKAWPAGTPPPLQPGNGLYGGEVASRCLVKQWPGILFFAIVSIAVFVFCTRAAKNYRALGEPKGALDSSRFAALAIAVPAVLWAALFFHNLGHLDNVGFDVPAHLDYIYYIQTHHALPLATDGWEMCHPPLYYLLCALILAPLNLAARSASAVYVIRMFGLCLGVLHFALVFLSARLLFPKQLAKQIFCLLFAAFLPEQLYLAHYVTNEFLAATLVTASIYFCLRLLKSPNGSPLLAGASGLCLGAALSTKASALVAVPFVLGAVACWPIVNQRMNLKTWFRTLGVAAIFAILTGSGHYIRVWKHFGKPIVQDWDDASGFAWWANNGFQSAPSVFGFGESLIRPFYSSFHSIADGIYSTLWGDGLYGGLGTTDARPPWNFLPMAAGYLLALVPTVLILTGLIASVVRFIRRPQTSWFLLLGIFFTTAAALLYMNLELPFYCNAKAFYGLLALLPICAAGAIGWETLCRTSRMARPLLCLLMGTWALNAYSSYWIHPDSPETLTSTGIRLCSTGNIPAGMSYLSAAQRIDPRSFAAQRNIAMVTLMRGNPIAAESEVRRILSESPNDGNAYCALAIILASREKWDAAFQNARRAIQLEPDLFLAYKSFGDWLVKLKKDREAVDVCRSGLRIEPMNPDLHLTLASALDDLGDTAEAEQHFRFACNFDPDRAEAHDSLGRVLAKQNKYAEAIEQFSQAVKLKPKDTAFQLHLADAYLSSGDPRNAIQSLHKTLALDPDNLDSLEKLAWLLATAKDDQLRNGKEALTLAQHACELTNNNKPRLLGVLAAAYAEAGRYSDAIASAQRAITLAEITGEKDLVTSNSQYLELYRANRPCRQ